MKSFKEDQIAAQNEKLRQQSEAALNAWLAKHPEVRDCIANRKMFESYADFTDGLTESDFDFCYSNLKSRLVLLRIPSHAEQVIEENNRRNAMTVDELRHLARQERPVPKPDELPTHYTPIGRKRPIELTSDVLRKAGTRTGDLSTADLKFLVRRYGATKVNERLGYRPRPQIGQAINISDFVGGKTAAEEK